MSRHVRSFPNVALRPAVLAVQLAVSGSLLAAALWAPQAHAQAAAGQARRYDIPAGSLTAALNRFAEEAGVFLSAPNELAQGKSSAGLSGSFTVEQGFAELLRGQGLEAVQQAGGTYVLRALASSAVVPAAAPPANPVGESTLPAVRVRATAERSPNELPAAYAGGKVARGGGIGMLGNKDVMDTPFAQTSYTAQLIEDTQARTIADVLKNDASVVITAPSNSGWEAAQSRGFSIGDSSDSTSFNGLYGILPYYTIDVSMAERVEVFKGPSALLNGMPMSNSTGGSLNIVSKRAQDEPGAQIVLGYASESQGTATVNAGRRFGESKQLGVHFNGSYRDGEGAISPSKDKFTSAMLGLDLRLNDRARLSADVGYQKRELAGPNRPLFLAAGVDAPDAVPTNKKSYLPSWLEWNDETTFGMLRGEFDIADNLSAYVAYGAARFQGLDIFMNPVLQNAAGDFNATPSGDGKGWGYDTRSGVAGLRFLFGTGPVQHTVNLNYSDIHRDNLNAVAQGNATAITSNIYAPADLVRPTWTSGPQYKSGESDRSSLGISDTLSMLDDNLQFTVGARNQKVASRSFTAAGALNGVPYSSKVWSPAFTVLYKPSDRVSVYANYIEGLQPGRVVGNTYNNEGEVFPPYKSRQYEAGAKFDFSERLLASLSAYQIKQPNTLTLPTQPKPTLVLDGEQRNRGVDFSVAGEPVKGTRITGGASYLDARLTKTQGGLTDGRQAISASKWKFVLAGDWDAGFLPGLALSARVRWVDKAYIDATNTFDVAAYTLWDAGLRYRFQPPFGRAVVARLNVDNLLDKNFWMAYGNGGVIQPTPRTVKLSVTFDF